MHEIAVDQGYTAVKMKNWDLGKQTVHDGIRLFKVPGDDRK